MQRTILKLLGTVLTATFLFGSCKGPQGDPGPQGSIGISGASGTTGAAGSKGPTGDAGTPNVVYSDWITFNWTVSGNGVGDNSYYTLTAPTTANPLFSKEAITSAAIFTYAKFKTYEDSIINGNYGKYKLVERISNNRFISHYFKVPGRTDATFFDYGFAYVNIGGISENYFSPSIQVNTFTLGQPIPELKNRSANFVQALVGNLPQFRHVIVYGGTKGGRLAAVDWSNYDEVKRALHLTD